MIEYAILTTLFIGVWMMVTYVSRQTGTVAGVAEDVARVSYTVPTLYPFNPPTSPDD